VFPFPKPSSLIYFLCKIATSKEDIILDFFSGSATTAHAVMKLNCEDNGNRKYILMQYPEKLEETSDAYKAGYRTICDIGKARIQSVANNLIKDNANSDLGFKVFEVSDTNIKWNFMNEIGQININQIQSSPDTIDFMPNFNDIDVVYELMLRQRDVALSEKLEQLTEIGKRTYLYANSFLICLETEITEKLVESISRLNPVPIKFIFRDSAFKDDIALKDETFRRLKALVEKNSLNVKNTYTVEFI
jgi:adenine-specific DNA-methyltransferase